MSTGETQLSQDSLARLRIQRRDEPIRSSFRRRLMWMLFLLIMIVLVGGGFSIARQNQWLSNVAEFVPEAIRSTPEVRVSAVVVRTGRSADALVVATGYLESRRQAMIGARAAGRIEVINVEEGSRVSTGEILAVLEHKDMDAALAATRATLTQTKSQLAEQDVEIARTKAELDRAMQLRDRKSIPDSEFDQAKFAYQAAVVRRDSLEAAVSLAEARVRESEQFNENMIIRAPFDGTVISKDAEVGESILPGGMGEASGRGSVVTIADLQHLEVDCDVKEDYISRVTPGAPAEVTVDAVPDRRYQGRVRKIIPMGDRARATIKVKVEILDADERLFPEMSGTVSILPEGAGESPDWQTTRVFCDSDAVRQENDGWIVWRLDDESRAERVAITIGEVRDGRTEVISGLAGGEKLILNPPAGIAPGMLLSER